MSQPDAAPNQVRPRGVELLAAKDLDYGRLGAVIDQDAAAGAGVRGFVHLRPVQPMVAQGGSSTRLVQLARAIELLTGIRAEVQPAVALRPGRPPRTPLVFLGIDHWDYQDRKLQALREYADAGGLIVLPGQHGRGKEGRHGVRFVKKIVGVQLYNAYTGDIDAPTPRSVAMQFGVNLVVYAAQRP